MSYFLLFLDICFAFGAAYLMHAFMEGKRPFKSKD